MLGSLLVKFGGEISWGKVLEKDKVRRPAIQGGRRERAADKVMRASCGEEMREAKKCVWRGNAGSEKMTEARKCERRGHAGSEVGQAARKCGWQGRAGGEVGRAVI